jgi:hypothetical protein
MLYLVNMKGIKHTKEQRDAVTNIQRKMTERVFKSKKSYTRKPKHK